jgi:hypothetical protein
MDDSHESGWEEAGETGEPAGWPIRPVLLALLGLATGYGAYWIAGREFPFHFYAYPVVRLAALTALTVGAGMIGFTLERRHWWASLLFALVAAGVAAGIVYWNGSPADLNGGDAWRTVSLFLALAIAAPLFQALRDSDGRGFPYAAVHDHAWTNVVLWCACWIFVGIVWMLMALLASLFHVIRLDFLQDLLREQWFGFSLTGLAFGGALGLLREHDTVVRLLQRVVATVLAVLAPVMAVGLFGFLLALFFTGLEPLWGSWVSTTPLLLACVIGALILANSVIGNSQEHESRIALLRWGAMLLAVVMLPLAVLAAVATGLRVGQYGFTPERLWALTFIVIATAYGLAYFVSLLRSWMGWAAYVRPANLNLAFGLCAIALLLATPLISFNAISTSDQVARLESGKIAPDKFDWAALAFDFGEPGKAALAKLQASKNPQFAERANKAAGASNRWDLANEQEEQKAIANLRILPAVTPLADDLRELIAQSYQCSDDARCTLLFLPGGKEALLFKDACFENPAVPAKGPAKAAAVMVPGYCDPLRHYELTGDKWGPGRSAPAQPTDAQWAAFAAAYKDGKIEVRPVTRRQAFVAGVPVGEAFE